MLKNVLLLFILGSLLIGLASLIAPAINPPGPVSPYLNGVFSEKAPSSGGSWELEEPFPNLTIPSPLRILDFPGPEDFMVLSKLGEIWGVKKSDQSKRLFLDIKDRSFNKGESGCTGMVLHPKFGDPSFPDKQVVFVFYRYKPEPTIWADNGFNRVSKFKWDEKQNKFDENSEEILIQQYDRSTWHNGGAMFFGTDGFLYISFGDEGEPEFIDGSNQRLDGGMFGGLIRIDIDRDPEKSHPIVRQPIALGNPPNGWGETYTQGYFIPNDNPWIDPSGENLEEFYAIGVRSPYSVHYDHVKEKFWIADVGSNVEEEISIIEKGDNLQWPYMEGNSESEDKQKPLEIIGNEKTPLYSYDRMVGTCIIGGGVYREGEFSSLKEKYLFADYINGKIMALTDNGSFEEPTKEDLIGSLDGLPFDLPEKPGITGLHIQDNGEIYVTVTGENFFDEAKILRIKRKTFVADPPLLLSELGVFSDLQNLETVEGIIPYKVNAPLWSDNALKQRWFAVPNDGAFDSSEEKILFNSMDSWTFPEGTVFIKHFGLPLSEDSDPEIKPLETRFFIIGKDQDNYGLSYKWNEDGTDAELQGGGSTEKYLVKDSFGETFEQKWDYPSRSQCLSCHNENAKYVLGVNTHQLNRTNFYPSVQQEINQLDFLNQLDIFQRDIGQASEFVKSYPLEDASISLEKRIRSYLDSNCASCHTSGVIPMVNLNLRYNTPLHLTNMVNAPIQSQASKVGRFIVRPGDHQDSELWVRDASTSTSRMPPISRHLVDQNYIDSLAKWIDELPMDAGSFKGVFIYPNPSNGLVNIVIGEAFISPFLLSITSLSGNIIEHYNSDLSAINLDLRHLQAGIYFLELRAGDSKHLEKFILH